MQQEILCTQAQLPGNFPLQRAPSPASGGQNPMLLEELMDMERRERTKDSGENLQNPLTVSVAPQYGQSIPVFRLSKVSTTTVHSRTVMELR